MRISSKYLQHALNMLKIGLLIINEEGRIIYLNKKFASILKIKKSDILKRGYYEKLSCLNLDNIIDNGVESGSKEIEINSKIYLFEYQPILNKQKISGYICLLIDKIGNYSYHEIKSNEDTNNELNDIIESSYDGIWVSDEQGTTIHVNSAYERITGINRKMVLGKKANELVQKGYYTTSVTDQVLKEKRRCSLINRTSTGKKILVTGNPIFDEQGKIKRVVTNVRDITELKNLQKQLEDITTRYERQLQKIIDYENNCGKIIINSNAMKKVMELTYRVSLVESNVLILGESGVGKELIAERIHKLSARKSEPFIKVNCSAIPGNLLESELFGYEKGAFTGAKTSGKKGMFELANNGTLFLDEIGDLPADLQVKLLRAIQDKEIIRVGGTNSIQLNIRLITATNRNLEKMVAQGEFREDLYYRLNVIPIKIPPLRERKDDIPLLVKNYLDKFNKKYGVEKKISKEVMEKLIDYSWPGNVRQLINVIERMVVLSNNSIITISDLPSYIQNASDIQISMFIQNKLSLKEALSKLEKIMIKNAMEKSGSTRKAAKLLGIDQSSVVRKMQKYKIKNN